MGEQSFALFYVLVLWLYRGSVPTAQLSIFIMSGLCTQAIRSKMYKFELENPKDCLTYGPFQFHFYGPALLGYMMT